MKYRLLAIDLDDTALNGDKQMTARTVATIRRAQAAGVTVVIATGRMIRGAQPFIDQLALPEWYAISYVGAMTVDWRGNVLSSYSLPSGAAHELTEYCHRRGLHLQFYTLTDYIYREEDWGADVYAAQQGFRGVADPAFLDDPNVKTPKALIIEPVETIDALEDEVKRRFPQFRIGKSKPEYLDITTPDITKGRALAALCKTLGIDASEVVAIGDNEIDVDMIEFAGLGIAMGNSVQYIKDAADAVAPTNDEDGVAYAIEKYILGEV